MEKDRKRPRAFLLTQTEVQREKQGCDGKQNGRRFCMAHVHHFATRKRNRCARPLDDMNSMAYSWMRGKREVNRTHGQERSKNFFKIILQKIGLKRRKMQKKQVDYSNMRWIGGGSVVWNGRFAGEKMRWVICLPKRKKVQKNKAGAII